MKKFEKYKIVLQWDEEAKGFLATAPELGNCKARANTIHETLGTLLSEIQLRLNSMESEGKELPIPFSERHFSGKILFRTSPVRHRDIAMKAALDGISISRWIEKKLTETDE